MRRLYVAFVGTNFDPNTCLERSIFDTDVDVVSESRLADEDKIDDDDDDDEIDCGRGLAPDASIYQ